MSDFLISFLLTIGASTWVYTKLQNKSGGNSKQSIIATGVVALAIFILSFSILGLIF
jgi:hypothetical protein